MKINKEKMQLLKRELREYEKVTIMTGEERAALHEWVAAGNSVHENGSMASYENGRPVIFWMYTVRRKRSGVRLIP